MNPPSSAHRGLFISFEGGDGVGKSTQAARLAEWFRREAGREVVTTREPGGTGLGVQLRELLLHGGEMAPKTEALIYAADRAQHVSQLIEPALAAGKVVITDRYLDSSVAYQAGGRTLDATEIEGLSLWATGGLLPDRTFLLDVPLEESTARLGEGRDRLERAGKEFHRRTREAFLFRAASDPGRWVIIDATRSVAEVGQAIVESVEALLGGAE
ncbi:dTMP kinase [Rarobacter faecitabidus]|uniref:Thymidylate kinase n=1 Tax=Rarobacter faecitabidus TaxID=13243 RepID=A0A542ZTG0_RARFA|nr:dTMP kinase [Rarobacter faecitabidus]TQL63652.1 thymidylate kinase [Rarobacter faecitabidus]